MKTKTIKTKGTGSWALPGDPITLDEFKAGIKEAEKGPFLSCAKSLIVNRLSFIQSQQTFNDFHLTSNDFDLTIPGTVTPCK